MSKAKKKLRKEPISTPQEIDVLDSSVLEVLAGIGQTMDHFVPDWKSLFRQVDPRTQCRSEYSMDEIILGALQMFLLRQGSRNRMNLDRRNKTFVQNYQKLFGCRLPHMDTVTDVLNVLPIEQLEKIRTQLMKYILKKRSIHKFRLLQTHFCVAIDGTGLYTFDKEPYPNCPFKTKKSGKKLYYQNVLEAKLICSNGFSLSIGSEWLKNEDGKEKQDCELNAMKRLVKKLKQEYPRLPVCIVLDGLYANGPTMELITQCGWKYIIVWKETCLKSVWEQLEELDFEGKVKTLNDQSILNTTEVQHDTYKYNMEPLEYYGFPVFYADLQCQTINSQTKGVHNQHNFVYLTNIELTDETVKEVAQAGRMRWKIENEGFNAQKNGGMELHHKYVEKNLTGMGNYYLCLQISHIIEQLITLCRNKFHAVKTSWKAMWQYVWAYLFARRLSIEQVATMTKPNRLNYRY